MQKPPGQSSLGRATGDPAGAGRGSGRAPPSPTIPPKRAKVTAEEGGPAAPVFLQELKDTAAALGCDLVLRVVVAGRPQPHLTWYKEKAPFAPPREGGAEEEYGSLRIRNSKAADAGLYSCVAKNEHGEAASSATVTITGLEDSETGEDDASSTQVTQRSQLQDETTYSSPTGESDTLVDASMKTTPTSVPGLSQTDEHSSWSGSQATVLEKDPEAGPTVRGPYLHPSIPSSLPHGGYRRDEANSSSKTSTDTLYPPAQKPPLQRPVSPRAGLCPVQPLGASRGPTPPVAPRRKLLMPPDSQDTALEEFDEKLKRPKSSGYSQAGTGESRPQTPLSEASSRVSVLRPSPKLPRSGSKIFDKFKFFEERRKSLEQNENPFAGHTWLPLRKTRSFDQPGLDDASPFFSAGSQDDLQADSRSELGGVAFRRQAFHQKAASLDERGRFSSRVHDLEHKFTEELGRIKRTVSQQQLRRSQELFRSPSPHALAELPAPRVPPPRKLKPLKALPLTENAHGVQQLVLSSVGLVGSRNEPKGTQKLLSRNGATAELDRGPKEVEMNGQELRRKVEHCLLSHAAPLGRRDLLQGGPLESNDCVDGGSMNLAKASHEPKDPNGTSRAWKRESGQDGHSLPWGKGESGPERSRPVGTQGANRELERKTGKVMEKKDNALQLQEGKSARNRGKGRRTRHTSPEPESSDDSYISAGEDPLEAPIFEIPIQDVTITAGTEVLFKCIITGNPSPEVSWRKDGIPFRSSTARPIKAEGERHTLLVRSARVADGGLYTVCATNEVGEACCSAILTVRPAPPESHSRLVPRHELSSPVTSDEEYLSPLEEFPESSTPRHHPVMRVQPRSELGQAPAHVGTSFKAAPSFEVALGDQAVQEGQDVVLRIRVQGEPKPIVHWLKNRHPVKYGRRISAVEEEDGSFCLYLRMVECTDAGYYACKAINEYGTKQCEAKLDIQVHPETQSLAVLAPLQDVVVGAGDAAIFECLVSSPPDVDVDWLWRGRLLQPALLQCKMHFDGRKCKLLLTSVHEDDSGIYTCKLSTVKDELTCSAKLTVWPSRQPLFTRKLEAVAVVEGRTARFDCKISGEPPPTITWTRFGQPVQEGETARLLRDGGLHSLVMLHVSSKDEGQYGVTAINKHGRAECTAELYVEEPRPAASSQISKLEKMPSIPEEPEQGETEVECFTMPDFLRPLHDLDVVESKEAVLECQVAGLPYPTITWFHNGRRIESTDDRRMMQYKDVHRLVFISVSHAHAGVYKSVIANKVGKATCYAHLYVTDVVPTPPDGPPTIAAVTGRAVTLKWNKPKWLDSAIDPATMTYTLQQQVLGSSHWTVCATGVRQTSYTILSLKKGIRYMFRVLTATAKANSKPSPPTEPVQLLDRGPYLEEAPVILDKLDVVYAVEGQPACITVTLNHVEVAVTWRRAGVVLKDGDPRWEMSMPDDDQHSLRFLRVGKGDVGEMTCEVSNQHGYDHCFISLELAEAPRFESIMEDIEVGIGETPQFAVVVEAKPLPDIMWYKDEVLLTESNHLSFVYEESECSLVVLNTTEQDSGVYTCTARNLAGEVSCKAELVVRAAVPDADAARAEEESHTARRLAEYYDIHEELGRGAFSYVRRVTQKSSGLAFAAKFIPCRAKAKKSARRELGILAQLDHEHIVYFHDAFEKRNALIIVMELCTGDELLERIARKSSVSESEPENLLLAEPGSDQVRICDFGNAQELTPDEPQYCKYGTPEFVGPEIVSQSPVSGVTDVWPVGVITYLSLTGISPFVGENDKTTLMNIRNYNVAFEESMFTGLTREAKGFVIKVLVNDRLRPSSEQTLEHPWFKTLAKGKSISTDHLKLFISRRKWQRSQIRYKCNMVPRPIPELLEDTSSHLSIAVPRLLKETSVLSSSSDSDDPEELPYIPMPHQPEFSGSRMSLTEIPTDDEPPGSDGAPRNEEGASMEWQDEGQGAAVDPKRKEEGEPSVRRQKGMLPRKRSTEAEKPGSSDEEAPGAQKRPEKKKALKKGSSLDSPDATERALRKGGLRRGSSADSALLLNLPTDEPQSRKSLTKAASMELPRRSPSPGTLYHRKGGLPEEEYAQRLELMRQRLLHGSPVDGKLSGLRGPLLETLGLEKKALRPPRLEKQLSPGHKMVRAASSETAPQHLPPEGRLLQKSSSFSQGDGEPVTLHRRSGAPLEIPLAQAEAQRLKETPSLSALNDSRPHTPHEPPSKPPTPELEAGAKPTARPSMRRAATRGPEEKPPSRLARPDTPAAAKTTGSSRASTSPVPILPTSSSSAAKRSAYAEVMQSLAGESTPVPHKEAVEASEVAPEGVSQILPAEIQSHTTVPAKMAAQLPGKEPSTPVHSSSTEHIVDIDSEEVFEAKFKRGREGSLSKGRKLLSRSEERRLAGPLVREEGIYRPGPAGAPLELSKSVVSRHLGERSRSVQDLHEVEKEGGFIRRMSMRLRRTPPTERRKVKEDEAGGAAQDRRLSWGLASKDKKDTDSQQSEPGSSESPVMAVRRKIGSTMGRLSTHLRSHSQQHTDEEHAITAGDHARQPEKRAPFLSQLRRATSEGENLRQVGIPQNQLAAQSANVPSTESFQSDSSTGNVSGDGHRRISRWERWSLSRSKKDRVASQPNIPASLRGDGVIVSQPYVLSESDFPPVFHIKLKDQVLLEGEAMQLCCLPAASPAPRILWMKDKHTVVSEGVLNIVACKDGRQLLTISKVSKKDAGLYECNATNVLGTATSSCTLAVARLPGRPGTPEIPQKYRNTVLVLWRPADTQAPCTYLLERKMDGEHEWKMVGSGIADCYFNATDLPAGSTIKFRVACVNKAGQGPYSNPSGKVFIEGAELKAAHSAVTAKKTITAPEKAASTRSTQTFPDQPLQSVLKSTGPMPSTPPRKNKGMVPVQGQVPAVPPVTQAEEKSAVAEKQKLPITALLPSSKDVPSSEGPTVAGSASAEPTSQPSRNAPSFSTHSVSLTTKISPAPVSSPTSLVSRPITSPKQTPTAEPPTFISPKAVPYVVTSFVSIPPRAPSTTESAPSLPFTPITEEAPSHTRFLSRSTTPGRDSSSGVQGRPTSSTKDESSLRQGVPQKPYTFLDEKARGRFGVIRECKENATGKRFMAKIVPYEMENKQTILQEYEILKGLHDEHIMTLHEAYITPRYLVLIAEHCTGKEILYHFVDRFRYSEDDVVGYVTQILQGLEYLHGRRIIHLDLKPDNIIVNSTNVVKILDFGSAQTYNPLVLRQLGRRVGTLEYMSPEMVKGDPIGSAADIWGLGVLIYIMLSGRSPFFEMDPLEAEARILAGRYDAFKLYPNVSQSAALFIRKVLCVHPWSRPTIKDCFANPWLQDAYLMKLRRQTLTFTTSRLKEFLVEHQRRRNEVATKHKVLLRSYHGASSHMP
ncbi:striated muscle preferentially expressed protein kinase isoform X2 [Varanus komodoensis]|uniref:striated muscle preferentially expressed protein kinase isoform X2 n=1 Tax=Varanus komodoensis TaxID=61221 RepID=UPI001CF79044|nr:striated muscle preferentially expressed protein kinase isoform X2 [Varanus komodoensis]